MGPEGIPPSPEALLALLPQSLRAGVLAHFGQVPTTIGVGTAVGTNERAAETRGFGGAASP